MGPEPIRLVIFDFDGVLADSEGIAIEELAAEITARGAPITPEEAQARFLGASTRDHMAYIADRTGQPCGSDFPDCWHARLFGRYSRELQPVPGAVETLDQLQAAGVAACIGSGGAVPRLAFALRCLGMAARFEGRAFSAEMVARGKPAPDLFLFAAAQMGVSPAECVVIEDAVAGLRAARAAGMRAVGFTGGSHLAANRTPYAETLRQEGAEAICTSHAELRDWLAAAG